MDTLTTNKRQAASDRLDWEEMLSLSEKLCDDGKCHWGLFILLGCHFGLRFNRLILVRWCDILDNDCIELREKKTGKVRSIAISDTVRAKVSKMFRNGSHKADDYIFKGRSGSVWSIQYVNKELKRIKERYSLSVDAFSTHSLRKTFGRRVYDRNGQQESALVLLMGIFGHSSLVMTRIYIGLRQEEIREAYLNL